MDVQVVETGELTRTVTVTIPKDDFDGQVHRGLKKVQRRHKQRGFRPGKVPMGLIKSKFGKAVEADVIDNVVRDSMPKAIEDCGDGVVHVSRPEVVGVNGDDFGLQYTFRVENMPKIEVASWEGLEVEKTVIKVSDEALQEALEGVQRKHAARKPLDRTEVQDGDVITLHYHIAGTEVTPDEEEREHEITVGSEGLLPGFSEGLMGATVGEGKTIEVPPPNGEGDPVKLDVKVTGIYTQVLPEIDDELARDEGAETLLDLRLKLREELAEGFKARIDAEFNTALGDALVAANEFDIPSEFFENQLEQEVYARLKGLVPDPRMLQQLNLDLSGLKDGMRDSFNTQLRRSLLLEALSESQEIEISGPEIDAWIEENVPPQQQRSYRNEEGRSRVRMELRLARAWEMVQAAATVTEVEREASHFDEAEEDHGHDHDHGHSHDHGHDHDHDHGHEHSHDHGHSHDHANCDHDHSHASEHDHDQDGKE